MLKEIEKAVFVESNVHYISGLNLTEHFVVSINGEDKRIYLRCYEADPLTGRATKVIDLKPVQDLIESYKAGDLVDLTVSTYEWEFVERRETKYYLISISMSGSN